MKDKERGAPAESPGRGVRPFWSLQPKVQAHEEAQPTSHEAGASTLADLIGTAQGIVGKPKLWFQPLSLGVLHYAVPENQPGEPSPGDPWSCYND